MYSILSRRNMQKKSIGLVMHIRFSRHFLQWPWAKLLNFVSCYINGLILGKQCYLCWLNDLRYGETFTQSFLLYDVGHGYLRMLCAMG